MIKIYHNNRCGKSRDALSFLKESGKDFELINYLENTPSVEELTALIAQLNIKPFDLIRKTESIYKENFKGKNLRDAEWIEVMVQNPILIERPIVVVDGKAVIARPTERILEIL
jgi:arsenate reductase